MADSGPAAFTILVADDEPLVLNIAETILRRHGFTVLAARDGSAALELFHEQEQDVDLVLTDVMMPVMSGPQLVHRIHQRNGKVPCIYMSGYSSDQIREKGEVVPNCDYLMKPFTPAALLSMVRKQLSA